MSKRSPKWLQKYIEKTATQIIMNPSRQQILKGISNITPEAFLELEHSWREQVRLYDLCFTSKVSQDLDKYKSKTCQTVILAIEQQSTKGDVIIWYIADPSKTYNAKGYSSNTTDIYINDYKKLLWIKIKLLLLNTFYFQMMILQY
jgi:hypothetical protein